ncbi:hypothetical protein Hsc_3954 [Herbaspirillum seropedicae]|nr:hypothetical protein Hsc_3954 [Herbaspirillum seropedicae]
MAKKIRRGGLRLTRVQNTRWKAFNSSRRIFPADFRPGSYSCKKWKLSQRLPPDQARQHCGEKSKKPPAWMPTAFRNARND